MRKIAMQVADSMCYFYGDLTKIYESTVFACNKAKGLIKAWKRKIMVS